MEHSYESLAGWLFVAAIVAIAVWQFPSIRRFLDRSSDPELPSTESKAAEHRPGARNPYKSGVASLLVPGLGQLYNGELRKALMFWAAGAVLVLLRSGLVGLLRQFWGMIFVLAASIMLTVVAVVDAWRTAESLQTYKPQPFNRWFVYLAVIAVSAFGVLLVSGTGGVRAFKIPTESMQPTLLVGDHVIVRLESPDSYEDQRGDVLVINYPGDNRTKYIKRVVAFAGEVIELRGGALVVDGQVVAAPWTKAIDPWMGMCPDFGPVAVPDGTVFVLGDNLAHSADSRAWGPLPRRNIVGVAEFVYFSWDPFESHVRFNRIGHRIGGQGSHAQAGDG